MSILLVIYDNSIITFESPKTIDLYFGKISLIRTKIIYKEI